MSVPKGALTALFLAFTSGVSALPAAITAAPSPSISGCSFHEDHWDCPTPCSTIESVQYGIDTTVSNYPGFVSSLNKLYSTSGVTPSGSRIPVFTTTVALSDGETFTAYGFYHSAVLEEAGYRIVSSITTIESCPTEEPTLPPSPTGSICSPHGDHWHCEPSPTASVDPEPEETCTPHGDHWHCPPGVPEPTSSSPPPAETTGSGECEPHGDHWHCPPGVPEPTTPLPPRRQGDLASASLMVITGTVLLVFPSRQGPLLPRPQDRASVSLTAITGIALPASQSPQPPLLPRRQGGLASVSLMVIIGIALLVSRSLPPLLQRKLRGRASVRLMVTIGTVPRVFPSPQAAPLLQLRRRGRASVRLTAIIGTVHLVSQSPQHLPLDQSPLRPEVWASASPTAIIGIALLASQSPQPPSCRAYRTGGV